MDYYGETGYCYGLTSKPKPFRLGLGTCATWAPGVHVEDIQSEVENDVCTAYLNKTDKLNVIMTSSICKIKCVYFSCRWLII